MRFRWMEIPNVSSMNEVIADTSLTNNVLRNFLNVLYKPGNEGIIPLHATKMNVGLGLSTTA